MKVFSALYSIVDLPLMSNICSIVIVPTTSTQWNKRLLLMYITVLT